jgi:II/X family phage/plasmid replication protein
VIDTVKLLSPELGMAEARALERVGLIRSAVEGETGEQVYALTTAELEGSYDHKTRVRLVGGELHGYVRLQVEGSVHKAILGHNCYGGPRDLLSASRWYVDTLSKRLGLELPDGGDWEVHQVDWANCYELGSFEAVQAYISTLAGAAFPRRKVQKYGDEAIMVPGRLTTIKLYHKGPEFSKHDFPRLKRPELLGFDATRALQLEANSLLRSEVSIKRRLVTDGIAWDNTIARGVYPTVRTIKTEYLESTHDADLSRLLKEGETQMETVRTYQSVKIRLQELHSSRWAQVLIGTWMQFSALGEVESRRGMKRATFYLHRKMLMESGCSWHSTDVRLVEPLFPSNFKPLSSDPRCLTSVHPIVQAALESYRAA